MKLLFTTDWLRRKIASDPDIEAGAGHSLFPFVPAEDVRRGKTAVMPERNVVQLRIALGTLVHQLRLKEGLTLHELAIKADISEEELRQVETNSSYTARARLIHQLSLFFKVSLNNLYQLSGTTNVVGRRLYTDAVQYAAHSDAVTPLTDDQREILDAFVAVLNKSVEQNGRD